MRVLVAVDFTDSSVEALNQGRAAVLRTNGALALCHVLPAVHEMITLFSREAESNVPYMSEWESEFQQAATEHLASLLRQDAGELFVDRGVTYAEIVRRADAWKADLLVIGSHGRTGLEHALLGGVTERVVRHAHCSVLVTRPTDNAGVVVAATDLSDPSLPAIQAAAEQARLRGARLVVASVVDWSSAAWVAAAGSMFGIVPAQPSLEQQSELHELLADTLRQALERLGAIGEPRVLDGSPAAAIVACAQELRAELVVVGTHGHSGLARLALGSVAEKVIRTATCPVLAVRHQHIA